MFRHFLKPLRLEEEKDKKSSGDHSCAMTCMVDTLLVTIRGKAICTQLLPDQKKGFGKKSELGEVRNLGGTLGSVRKT